jgi:Uma2 family endonuclease
VIEILSPRTAAIDKDSKRKVYAREGVEELWILDPQVKTVCVFRLQTKPSEPLALYGLKDIFSSAFFPGLDFRVAEIFRE